MCGIAGVQVDAGKAVDATTLTKLADELHHRGPDARGFFREGNIGLASTRLAIMDVAHGDQPLHAPSGVVLVANGEIYNSPELRATFGDYAFQTESDCEVILPLYEKYGIGFAEHLRGMYAIAIYDPRTERLILSRDPFGIKPLYLAAGEGFCAFASEIAPLVDLHFAPREADAGAERELLQLKYVIGSKTIIPNVVRLEPGETIVMENARIVERTSVSTWPRRSPVASRPVLAVSREDLLKRFTRVIEDSVAVHLRSDVPWCLFYSGGIDSTILMRVAQKVAAMPVRALTIGYDGDYSEDESRSANALAAASGVPCERIEMSAQDFWNLAPRIVASLDDPMADSAVLPLYMLAAAARANGFKVAISGEGADEVFGGYSRYRRALLPAFFRRKHRRGVFTGKQVSRDRFNGWAEDMDGLEAAQSRRWSSRMQVLQAVDLLERLPNCLLIKLDRALMANGIEGRTPFLDKDVVRFALEVPDRLKNDLRTGKRLLRDWLAREFPAANPYARKKGFDLPVGAWMAARTHELAPLISAQPGIARLFAPSEVRAVLDDCRRDAQPAWSLLCYALWHAHHILGVSAAGNIADVLSQCAESRRGSLHLGSTASAAARV